ncbi:MAG TPA: pyridoxamine 5'-phosphate oxidase [Parachlamydiaceae bacterium]|nr:pyridoxamine 5'-phosphate oxidase [Parachlamydiaceae bacterium]
MDIQNLRSNYNLGSLKREDLKDDPFDQFLAWLDDAVKAAVIEPNAMALSTVSKDGKPSSRMVLLKGLDGNGFRFFTNLQSRKSREIMETSFTSANVFWKELQRQVIIEGVAEKMTREDSEAYFATRPRGSQLSVWASVQDQIISSRDVLEEAYKAAELRYHDQPVPMPAFWGGFRIIPDRFEFWQGRPDRLHDRFQYVPVSSDRFQYTLCTAGWQIDRLSP